MIGCHIPCLPMRQHGRAIIDPVAQDGVAPKSANLGLMLGPILHMICKNRTKYRIPAHGGVESRDLRVDLIGGDGEGGREGGHARLQSWEQDAALLRSRQGGRVTRPDQVGRLS